jgi:Ran GTPase-activating protein (RanGAP) involved in mRNA processing and transport
MHKQCSILQLQGNAITSQGIIILIDALLNNSIALQDLWLSNNFISDLGVQILTSKFLLNNSTLKQLHLGSNCITDRGVQYSSEMLKSNYTLTDLWLYNNQITDQGVQNLANILKTGNRNLKHLDLQWNKSLTDSSINSFVNMLEQNRILGQLNLRKCNLSIAGKMQLLQAVVERKDFKLIT